MAFLDSDTTTRLTKKYRTQFASCPATVLAVLVGVRSHPLFILLSKAPFFWAEPSLP